MKVLMSWLRELCPTELSGEELADRLTPRGVKVEAVLRPWERLTGVVVARVLDVRDHPNSEKLCLARVTDGSSEHELVVGVRNMRPGDPVPMAGPGATVPALLEPLGRREIRGVVSEGMLCSPRELGISGDHQGILVLPADAPVGADVRGYLGLDDELLDIEVKANRPDLLSVAGVAREAAAATGVPFTAHDPSVREGIEKAGEAATVEILDLERCPRYVARVIRGVAVGDAPIRAQARLTAMGMRAISNVVDATNYALLETGQPLHPFDLDRLDGAGIIVRRAEEGERLVTLDDVERRLSSDDLVIADHAKAVAVAGVMGSASAEVSASTSDVLLESAHFDRLGVRRTAARLGLQTEASARFARGADPEAVEPAAGRAAGLIVEWSGGSVLAGSVDAGEPSSRRRLRVRPSRASLLLGHPVSGGDIQAAFGQLGMETTTVAGDGAGDDVEVVIPGFRGDLEREPDLIEEVARVQGYDRIGSTLPAIHQPGGVGPGYALRRRIRSALLHAGLRESLSYSFASQADLELMGAGGAVRLANPLSAEDGFLRTSLVPNLLRGLRWNLSRGVRGPALFELGHAFVPNDTLEELELVAFAMAGTTGSGFPGEDRPFDFFDAKGVLEALMEGLGVSDWSLGDPGPPPLNPARSAVVLAAGTAVGVVGEVHPGVARELDLPRETEFAELSIGGLARAMSVADPYRDVPRFPPVRRDLAFMVDEAVPSEGLRAALVDAGGDLVGSVRLFDVFRGGAVPEGKKSLAFSVDFRASDRTLTDAEADNAVRAIVERLGRDFGAELRAQ